MSSKQDDSDEEVRPDPPKYQLPPTLSGFTKLVLYGSYALIIFGLAYLVYFCVQILQGGPLRPDCTCFAYVAIVFIVGGLGLDRMFRHRGIVHDARVDDRNEVEALINEAKNVEPRLLDDPIVPRDFETQKTQILTEVERLEDIGPATWP